MTNLIPAVVTNYLTGWRQALAGKWVYTSTVTGTEPVDADEYRVAVRVEGNFPGGVADLVLRFALSGELIRALHIAA